jgi:WD40 repeat protein
MGLYRAVKFVYRKSFDDARPFERELSGIRIFEPLSRSHEGFVDVLHVGINEIHGYFYYVMELGDDRNTGQIIEPENYSPKTLATEISQKRILPVADCLRLGLALSQALSQLHSQGLVHRDIKPSNIIFVNGIPKLADIGLVTQVSEARSYVGTEGFIPPEGPGTPQADVFSLGKVLYEASTGKDRHDFPELPTQWDKAPDFQAFQELNEIILEACKNEPSARYPSAWEMYCDLLVLADGKSVKRLNLLERRFSNFKRIARLSVLALVALGLIVYMVYHSWRRGFEARQQRVGATIAYGTTAIQARDFLEALMYFCEALQLSKGDPPREAENRLRFSSVYAQCPKITQMWFVPGTVKSLGFSPDARRLVAVESLGKAHVFDVETGRSVSPGFGQEDFLWHGAFSPDGTMVVTASEDNTACLWKVSDGSNLLCLQHPAKVLSASFNEDGTTLVTGCGDSNARVWNAKTGQPILTLIKHTQAVLFAAYSPDGHRIVTTSRDGTALLWDAHTGSLVGVPLSHPTWVSHAAFSPDGRELITSCFDRKARVWDLTTMKKILPELQHDDGVRWSEFSPDGRMILTASLDPTVRLWDAANHQLLSPNAALKHSDRVIVATFSPDGHRIATGCSDGSIRVWDLAIGTAAPLPDTTSIIGDRSGYFVFSDGDLRVWDTVLGQAISPAIKPGLPLTEVRLSLDSNCLVTSSRSDLGTNSFRYSIQTWGVKSGSPAGPRFSLSPGFVPRLISNGGNRLLATSDNRAQVWETRSANKLSEVEWLDGDFHSPGLSPSGDVLAAWTGKTVRLWNIQTRVEISPSIHYPFAVRDVEFSPDETRVLVCGADDSLSKCHARIYLLATGQPIGAPLAHKDGILSAAFSPDGRRVVTASEDFTAVVWDAATGRQLIPPLKHHGHVRSARFSPDGKWILTASSDETARVWSSETGLPLSAPLCHFVPLVDAFFVRGQNAVATVDYWGHARLWRLPFDIRPVKELSDLTKLVSGFLPPLAEGSFATQTEYLDAFWRRLSATHPAEFTVSTEQIAAWHLFQADESEARKQWYAASFHIKRLQGIRPGDASLATRLRRTQEQQTPGH